MTLWVEVRFGVYWIWKAAEKDGMGSGSFVLKHKNVN